MKLIIILSLVIASLSFSNSIRIKNNKNNEKNNQYYNGNPTYNPGYQPNQSVPAPQFYQAPQVIPAINFNYGYSLRAPSNENYIEMTRSQSDKPIKIANVL